MKSFTALFTSFKFVGDTGVEPVTSTTSMWRSTN